MKAQNAWKWTVPLVMVAVGAPSIGSAQDTGARLRPQASFQTPAPSLFELSPAAPGRIGTKARIPVSVPLQESGQRWYQSELFKIHIAPVTFWTLSGLTFSGRETLREVRNRFIPNFENSLDDVTQFLPAMGVYGLNLAGVPGRNTIGRASINLGIGAAVTALTVNGLKYSVGLERPDGSTNNSWPSGHTATAFATATFYHKEYGHYSTLHTVAAYSLASVTGIFRQLNNRHWLTDVFAGAGFGIWSANITYYFIDRWLGDRWRNPDPIRTAFDEAPGNPSFVNLKVGYATASGDLAPNTESIFAEDGANFAFEAAWFPWKNVGLGGDLSFAVFPVNSDNLTLDDPELEAISDGITTEALGSQSIYVGPFFDVAVSDRVSLRAKVTGGYWAGATGSVGIDVTQEAQEELELGDYLPLVQYDPKNTFGYLLGGAVRFEASRTLGFDLYVDYNAADPEVTVSVIDSIDPVTGERTLGEASTDTVEWKTWSIGVAVTGLIR